MSADNTHLFHILVLTGNVGNKSPAIERLTSTALELTRYLQENGQAELALQFSLDALSSVIQHVTAQDMGVGLDRSTVIL